MSEKGHRLSLAGMLVTIGIIYGDIGTSPLYVLKAIVGDREVTELLVYGGVSCIFWTLTIQTTFKYIILTLRADNKGEGGIFSLFALVQKKRKWLFWPAMIGAATLLCDGMITPPISVSSAVEGLSGVQGLEEYITPGNNLSMGIVIGIISLLFFFQRFGTRMVGAAFGPIMLVWFTMLLVLGVGGIIQHPGVLKSLNPVYAVELLTMYPKGFWLLGAIFLCTTGAEALYSDLGHCGKENIRMSWIFVKTALVVNYMGQAGWVMDHGALNNQNPFYAIMPSWWLIPGIVIATLAAFIASQALISGSFTLISEAVNLNFWPRIAIQYPTELKGQLYIPSVNWLLWAGCLFVVLVFRESSNMEAAYGFFIAVTMIMTTVLLTFYLRYKRRWPRLLVFSIVLLFLTVESGFFVANIVKLKEAWMMVIIYVLILHVMWITFMYRRLSNSFLKFVKFDDYLPQIKLLSNDNVVPKYASHLVYLTKADLSHQVELKIIDSILAKIPKRADVYWFVHIDRTSEPYSCDYEVNELVNDLIIKVNIRLGFRIQPRVNNLFRFIVDDMVKRNEFDLSKKPHPYLRYNENPDFKFVILDKYLSVDNDLNLRDSLITETYAWMKQYCLHDIDAWGLEEADTVLEKVPLVVRASAQIYPTRI
ncbi:MAG: KUP/HAK/KT family potassium transporter [Crocinitomicaceae bacterium]|nr:KUP/HAK/KT family potassium transporter [Crocinitomicaceae bacterium]